jgi:2-dehydropantoate 2-reductase
MDAQSSLSVIRQTSKGAPLKKILIFGAGVLGSLYAARLKQSAQDVTLLARSPHVVRVAVRAVREGFGVLHCLGIPITPAKLQMWEWIPESLLVRSLMLWADTIHFKTAAVEHTAAAADEMHQIAQEFRTLTLSASVATPAIDELRSYIPSPNQNDANA